MFNAKISAAEEGVMLDTPTTYKKKETSFSMISEIFNKCDSPFYAFIDVSA